MREDLLPNLHTLVSGVMFVVVGVIAALCLFLILRGAAFRPFMPRRRRQKSEEEEKSDKKKRKRVQIWFWDRG